jgi:AraC-like DNA-binding protein
VGHMGWYEPRLPHPDHAAVLACTWTARPNGRHRLVPDACMDLLCVWRSGDTPTHPDIWLCGPERSAWTFELPPGTIAAGVRFRPGCASLAFGLDASSLLDRRARFDDVVGRTAADAVRDRLADRDDLSDRASAFEMALSPWLTSIDGEEQRFVDRMTELLVRSPRVAQTDLAATAGITPRHLHRRLQQRFGHGAAMLGRQLRFQRFLAVNEQAMGRSSRPLAALATAAGYADQAHLSRDCRAITGLTVRTFLDEWFPTFPDMSDPFKTAEPLAATMGS